MSEHFAVRLIPVDFYFFIWSVTFFGFPCLLFKLNKVDKYLTNAPKPLFCLFVPHAIDPAMGTDVQRPPGKYSGAQHAGRNDRPHSGGDSQPIV